jgi:dipeptidyl aminopeptidase/acylaminoacyl peptidase
MLRAVCVVLIGTTASCCLIVWAVAQDRLTPIPVEDALSARSIPWFARIAISPDGRHVAYVLTDPARRSMGGGERRGWPRRPVVSDWAVGCDVSLTRVQTSESMNLTGGLGSNWGPTWSPDGKAIAFFSDRSGQPRPWLWEIATGELHEAAEVLAVPRGYGVDQIRWTPDGKKLLLKTPPEGMDLGGSADGATSAPPEPADARDGAQSTVTVYRSPVQAKAAGLPDTRGNEGTGKFEVDLALVDIGSRAVERIVRGSKPLEYWVSPDGRRLAFANLKRFGARAAGLFENVVDVVVVPLEGGAGRVVASDVGQATGFAVSWSPDGKALAYTTSQGECYVISAEGGERVRCQVARREFGDRAPLWDGASRCVYLHDRASIWRASRSDGTAQLLARIPDRTIVQIVATGGGGTNMGRVGGGGHLWSPDSGQSIVVSTHDPETKRVGFRRVDLISGASSVLFEEDKYYGLPVFSNVNTDVSADGRSMVYVAQDARHAEDVWLVSGDLRQPRRVTRLNPEFGRYASGASRLIAWRGPEGQTLRGGLLLPAGHQPGRRCPLVVVVYGGNTPSDDVNRFGFTNFASGTFNMQLFATRGYAVLVPDAPLRAGTPLPDLANAVMPGVDKVIELGIADPDRLGVMGHSYGGYGVMCLLVQTPRFKAAVVRSGFADLVGLYGIMRPDGSDGGVEWAEVQGGMRGGPWQFRDRYVQNSPIFFLDRVATPLLLVHGASDNPFLADEIFVGLRHLGKEIVYANYGGEGHMQANWSHANRLDSISRIINWFDSHLHNVD